MWQRTDEKHMDMGIIHKVYISSSVLVSSFLILHIFI